MWCFYLLLNLSTLGTKIKCLCPDDLGISAKSGCSLAYFLPGLRLPILTNRKDAKKEEKKIGNLVAGRAYQLQSLLIELHSQVTAAFEERTLKAVDYSLQQTP